MKNIKFIAAILMALCGFSTASAQGLYFPGGRGLLHVHPAWTLEKGAVTLHSYTSSYYKTVILENAGQAPTSITFWDVQGALALHYASGKHLEWGLTQIVYQDTHHDGNGYDVPSDLSLNVKVGSFGSVQSHFRLGFLVQGRFPTGKDHNIPFEPYSAGTFEAGLIGMVSYSSDLLLRESGFNLHGNIGIWHNNDTGKFLTNSPGDQTAVLDPSRTLVWGIGAVLPGHQFDFGLELYGNAFAVRPPVTAYSREDFTYLTPSVNYRVSSKLSFFAGVDVRLTANTDKTRYSVQGTTLPLINNQLPSYPGWRVRFGGKLHLRKSEPFEIEKPLFTEHVDEEQESVGTGNELTTMQGQLVKERRKTEVAEEELTQIRNDRKKMEDMLARLRQILQYGDATTEEPNVADKAVPEEDKKVTKKDN